MGIVKKLGKPITGATRPQNRPQQIKQGGGTAAAQSQISAPPAPFQNPLGAANFQRNRTNDDATLGLGSGRTPNAANIRGGQPMSHSAVIKGAGYPRKPNLANYTVHDVTQHQFGPTSRRGNRNASDVTRGPNTTGRKRLVAPMSDADFAEGAKLYHREHGNL